MILGIIFALVVGGILLIFSPIIYNKYIIRARMFRQFCKEHKFDDNEKYTICGYQGGLQ